MQNRIFSEDRRHRLLGRGLLLSLLLAGVVAVVLIPSVINRLRGTAAPVSKEMGPGNDLLIPPNPEPAGYRWVTDGWKGVLFLCPVDWAVEVATTLVETHGPACVAPDRNSAVAGLSAWWASMALDIGEPLPREQNDSILAQHVARGRFFRYSHIPALASRDTSTERAEDQATHSFSMEVLLAGRVLRLWCRVPADLPQQYRSDCATIIRSMTVVLIDGRPFWQHALEP